MHHLMTNPYILAAALFVVWAAGVAFFLHMRCEVNHNELTRADLFLAPTVGWAASLTVLFIICTVGPIIAAKVGWDKLVEKLRLPRIPRPSMPSAQKLKGWLNSPVLSCKRKL